MATRRAENGELCFDDFMHLIEGNDNDFKLFLLRNRREAARSTKKLKIEERKEKKKARRDERRRSVTLSVTPSVTCCSIVVTHGDIALHRGSVRALLRQVDGGQHVRRPQVADRAGDQVRQARRLVGDVRAARRGLFRREGQRAEGESEAAARPLRAAGYIGYALVHDVTCYYSLLLVVTCGHMWSHAVICGLYAGYMRVTCGYMRLHASRKELREVAKREQERTQEPEWLDGYCEHKLSTVLVIGARVEHPARGLGEITDHKFHAGELKVVRRFDSDDCNSMRPV